MVSIISLNTTFHNAQSYFQCSISYRNGQLVYHIPHSTFHSCVIAFKLTSHSLNQSSDSNKLCLVHTHTKKCRKIWGAQNCVVEDASVLRCDTASHPTTLVSKRKYSQRCLRFTYSRVRHIVTRVLNLCAWHHSGSLRYLSRCCSESVARPAVRHQRCLIIVGVLLYLAVFLSQTSLHSTLCFLFYFVPPVPKQIPRSSTGPFSVQYNRPKAVALCLAFLHAFCRRLLVCVCVLFFLTTLSVNCERVWGEAGVAPYEVSFRPAAGGTDKIMKCHSWDNRFAVRPPLVPNVSQMNPIHILFWCEPSRCAIILVISGIFITV